MAFSLRRFFTRSDNPNPAEILLPGEFADPEENFQHGMRFAMAEGAERDFSKAIGYLRQAAEQGHCLAQLNLSKLYDQGQGTARNKPQSLLWLGRAAALGNADAQYQLGVRTHISVRGVDTEAAREVRIEALKWLRLSAAQGKRAAEHACEFVAIGMTWEDVHEAEVRSSAFVAH